MVKPEAPDLLMRVDGVAGDMSAPREPGGCWQCGWAVGHGHLCRCVEFRRVGRHRHGEFFILFCFESRQRFAKWVVAPREYSGQVF